MSQIGIKRVSCFCSLQWTKTTSLSSLESNTSGESERVQKRSILSLLTFVVVELFAGFAV